MAGLRNVPKNCWNLQNCVVSYTLYPNLPIFLHRYICHICDISQLCRRLTDEKFTGGHPCLAPRLERGEGGEHLVTLPAEPSKNFHTQYFLFTVLGENRRCKVLDYSSVFMTFFFFWEYIWSGREGIWKTCGGAIWISYRPQPLLFRWQRALGLPRDVPRPTKLQPFSPFPSPPLLVLWDVPPLNFHPNLSGFSRGPFDLNILSCS